MDIQELLKANSEQLLATYNEHIDQVLDLQATLIRDILPSVVDEFELGPEATEWAREWLNDTGIVPLVLPCPNVPPLMSCHTSCRFHISNSSCKIPFRFGRQEPSMTKLSLAAQQVHEVVCPRVHSQEPDLASTKLMACERGIRFAFFSTLPS